MENANPQTRKRSRNSRFRRRDDRYTSGSYMCRACTQRTRETGKGESEVALCRECYDGEPGNDLANGMPAREFAEKWAVGAVQTVKFFSSATRVVG